MKKTSICRLLDIQYPIIQAPMNWITGVELAAAVSNSGGLGTLGHNVGYTTITTDVAETGSRLREQIKKLKKLTTRPFAVNFSARSGPEFQDALAFSDECVRVAIEEGIPVAITTGTNPELYTGRFKKAGIKVLHRPLPLPTIEEARQAEKSGADAIVVVGYEAGGHSSMHRMPAFILVPQVVDAVKIPVVAGGGIADGRGVLAALALGAEGAYIGTAFIPTHECLAHPKFKQALIDAGDFATVTLTTASGSTRALRNPLSKKCVIMEAGGASIAEISSIARATYKQGVLDGDVDNSILACGAATGLIKQLTSVENLMRVLVK